MSLRGSLETVGLPDVLTLLATTGKTGELQVTGAQVEGRLWVRDGQLVASDAGRAPSHLDAVFELLRISAGTFSFDEGGDPVEAGEPTEIEPLLVEAGIQLTQWADIEAVVPSLNHVVRMVADAPEEEVIVRADQWRLLAATAGGLPVHDVIDAVELGDFDGSKALKELVEARLVTMEEPPPVVVAPIVEPVVEVVSPPVVVVEPVVVEPVLVEPVVVEPVVVEPVVVEPFAVAPVAEEAVSLDDEVTFEVVASPAAVPDDGSSIYDSEGGIDLSPVGSPAVGKSSDAGATPSWSLDSTGEDEGMTWTNDSAGTDDAAGASHVAGDDAAATWTHGAGDDDGGAAAANWTDGPGADDAAAAAWTHEPGADDAPAGWAHEPASEAVAAAWTDGAPGSGAANDAADAWTQQPARDDAGPVWIQEPSGREPAPTWTPEIAADAPVPAWSPAPVQVGDPPPAPAYGTGPAADHSGFIPSQRATDGQTAESSTPAPEPVTNGSEEPHTAEEADTDEPINRGLLLKFLSSVRS